MNKENCLSCILKAIVALQNNASKIDCNDNSCTKPYLGLNVTTVCFNTRPITLCSDALLDKIALKVQQYLEPPLLKFCLYYDGTDESCENSHWGFYERHWVYGYIKTNNQEFQWEVQDMIHHGISEDWIDSFGIPRTLVGIFFNRYCHWLGLYDIKDFMKWFENVRSGKEI